MFIKRENNLPIFIIVLIVQILQFTIFGFFLPFPVHFILLIIAFIFYSLLIKSAKAHQQKGRMVVYSLFGMGLSVLLTLYILAEFSG